MFDASHAQAVSFDDDEPTLDHTPARDLAIGTQPIPITEDTLHVRHVGQQTWHRAMAGSPTSLGYETACGLSIEFGLAEWRQQAHRGEPCTECFTAREVARFVPETASTWRFHETRKK